jgi:hypothetical protein
VIAGGGFACATAHADCSDWAGFSITGLLDDAGSLRSFFLVVCAISEPSARPCLFDTIQPDSAPWPSPERFLLANL